MILPRDIADIGYGSSGCGSRGGRHQVTPILGCVPPFSLSSTWSQAEGWAELA